MVNAVISGSGRFLPEKVVRNADFLNAQFFDESNRPILAENEQIISQFESVTEIRERRYVGDQMRNSDMAAAAGSRAIADAEVDKEQIDYVIVAHNFGDISSDARRVNIMPSLAAKVKHKLRITNDRCVPYDMIFGCPGWLEGLILANRFIQSDLAEHILVIGSETLSRVIDPHDRNRMIFADGAGAVVLSARGGKEKAGVMHSVTICDNGEELDYLKNSRSLNPAYDKSEFLVRMAGRKIYEYALKKVPPVVKETIESAALGIGDISKVLVHQANAKMERAILVRLIQLFGLHKAPENLMPMTVQTLGNSSVATIPTLYDLIAHHELAPHEFHSGDHIVFASVGAGMNVNAMVYRFPQHPL